MLSRLALRTPPDALLSTSMGQVCAAGTGWLSSVLLPTMRTSPAFPPSRSRMEATLASGAALMRPRQSKRQSRVDRFQIHR
jgi:hypothetical protein